MWKLNEIKVLIDICVEGYVGVFNKPCQRLFLLFADD